MRGPRGKPKFGQGKESRLEFCLREKKQIKKGGGEKVEGTGVAKTIEKRGRVEKDSDLRIWGLFSKIWRKGGVGKKKEKMVNYHLGYEKNAKETGNRHLETFTLLKGKKTDSLTFGKKRRPNMRTVLGEKDRRGRNVSFYIQTNLPSRKDKKGGKPEDETQEGRSSRKPPLVAAKRETLGKKLPLPGFNRVP